MTSMTTCPGPTAEDLRILAAKYRALAQLRAQRDDPAGPAQPDRLTLRTLAAAHPGCLRELDTLGLAELVRRAEALQAAAEGTARAPWMTWIWGYHALMRAALAVKMGLRQTTTLTDAALAALVQQGTAAAGFRVDAAFVASVKRPPGGRLSVVVLRSLGAMMNTRPATIAATLFPLRRPSPYTL